MVLFSPTQIGQSRGERNGVNHYRTCITSQWHNNSIQSKFYKRIVKKN